MPGIVAIRSNRPVHASFWIEGLDGRQRATESTAIPLRGVDNTVVGAMVMIWLAEVAPPEELLPAGAIPLAVPMPERSSGA